MKSEHQQRVEQFMRGAGQSVPDKPTVPDEATRVARARLTLEEAFETVAALGVDIDLLDGEPLEFKHLYFFVSEDKPFDMAGVIDGSVDSRVIATGNMSCMGVPDEPFQREVDDNNLAKLDGGYLDGNGKFCKPADHPQPRIQEILDELTGATE